MKRASLLSRYHRSCAGRCTTRTEGIFSCCKEGFDVSLSEKRHSNQNIDNNSNSSANNFQVLQSQLANILSELSKTNSRLVSIETQLTTFNMQVEKNKVDIEDIRQELNDLNNKLRHVNNSAELDINTTNHNSHCSNTNGNNMEYYIQEYREREKRKNNIILYNVEENKNEPDNDSSKVLTYLSKIEGIQNSPMVCRRLGNPSRDKVRRLLITMPSPKDAFITIKNKALLPKPVKVSSGRTVIQRQHLQKLLKELSEHNAKHPHKLKTLRYVNNIPCLIDAASKAKLTRTPNIPKN